MGAAQQGILSRGKYVTFLASAIGVPPTGTDVTIPAGVQDGDVGFLFDQGSNMLIAPPGLVTPAGWTNVVNITVSLRRCGISYKVLTAAEAGTTISGIAGTSENFKAMLVFRPLCRVSSIVIGGQNALGTTADPPQQDCTASAGAVPLVVLGCYAASADVTGRVFDPAQDAEVEATTKLYARYRIYNAAPLDTAIDMADSGSNLLASFYAQFL